MSQIYLSISLKVSLETLQQLSQTAADLDSRLAKTAKSASLTPAQTNALRDDIARSKERIAKLRSDATKLKDALDIHMAEVRARKAELGRTLAAVEEHLDGWLEHTAGPALASEVKLTSVESVGNNMLGNDVSGK